VNMDKQAVAEFTRAMGSVLDGQPFPPNASSMIGVQSLAMDGMLVEISAVAVLD
ncbi:MAG: RidA family protein, partial [Halieaceae bacterium]|nr:RidA family protein [Halieaceae bacterium]